MTQDRYIIADASSVTGAEFFAAVTGRPPRTEAQKAEAAERSAAWRDCQRMQREPGESWREFADRNATAYRARLDEIEAKYALAPVVRLGLGRIAA